MELTVGMKNAVEGRSTEETSAIAMKSGSLKVLSTPSMIALMEQAVPADKTSVGISIKIKHQAATPIGLKLRAEAVIIAVDGRKIIFEVKAFDEREEIGNGIHERFIVDRKKFQSKADGKK